MAESENNEFDGKIWASAIKSIGELKGEFKYISETLTDIKNDLKVIRDDCPKHQLRTAELERNQKEHLEEHASDLKKAVDLRASRVSIIIGAVMFVGNLILVSSDKILAWIWKTIKGT
jgi:hypothetical protein